MRFYESDDLMSQVFYTRHWFSEDIEEDEMDQACFHSLMLFTVKVCRCLSTHHHMKWHRFIVSRVRSDEAQCFEFPARSSAPMGRLKRLVCGWCGWPKDHLQLLFLLLKSICFALWCWSTFMQTKRPASRRTLLYYTEMGASRLWYWTLLDLTGQMRPTSFFAWQKWVLRPAAANQLC